MKNKILLLIGLYFLLGCSKPNLNEYYKSEIAVDNKKNYDLLLDRYYNLPSWFDITQQENLEYYGALWDNGFRPGFTQENFKKLEVGLHSDIVEILFGSPDYIKITTCGDNKPWQCTIWSYGNSRYWHENTYFMFGTYKKELRLNSWEIK